MYCIYIRQGYKNYISFLKDKDAENGHCDKTIVELHLSFFLIKGGKKRFIHMCSLSNDLLNLFGDQILY